MKILTLFKFDDIDDRFYVQIPSVYYSTREAAQAAAKKFLQKNLRYLDSKVQGQGSKHVLKHSKEWRSEFPPTAKVDFKWDKERLSIKMKDDAIVVASAPIQYRVYTSNSKVQTVTVEGLDYSRTVNETEEVQPWTTWDEHKVELRLYVEVVSLTIHDLQDIEDET